MRRASLSVLDTKTQSARSAVPTSRVCLPAERRSSCMSRPDSSAFVVGADRSRLSARAEAFVVVPKPLGVAAGLIHAGRKDSGAAHKEVGAGTGAGGRRAARGERGRGGDQPRQDVARCGQRALPRPGSEDRLTKADRRPAKSLLWRLRARMLVAARWTFHSAWADALVLVARMSTRMRSLCMLASRLLRTRFGALQSGTQLMNNSFQVPRPLSMHQADHRHPDQSELCGFDLTTTRRSVDRTHIIAG